MQYPIYVFPLTQAEHRQIEAGLRSSDAFVVRRCQILLASARGEPPARIAEQVGCSDQTVRRVLWGFNMEGLAVLQRGSSRPHTIHAAFDTQRAEDLRTLLHQSPRVFGKPTSLWTLKVAAEVSYEQGLTPERVTGETVRATVARLGIRWQRAKQWITSPDPEYARKKERATA